MGRQPDPKTTAGRRAGTNYPFLDDALDYLLNLQVLSGAQYQKLSRVEKLKTVGSSTIANATAAGQLHRALTDAISEGEGPADFKQRIKGIVDMARSDSERILRTHTKTAFVNGLTRTIEKPHIESAFGYVLYVATKDGRTRASHLALHGFVAKVGTPEYEMLKEALSDWNCRCSLIPLTAKQAESRGIRVYADLPPEIVRTYARAA